MASENAFEGLIIPDNEPERLAAIKRYDILDTPPDGSFDRVTMIAARRFGVPISIISIVDQDRIWFKSHYGLDATQISRDPGLCASAILSDEPWILEDAKKDIRALANPLVAGEFGLRFYAGIPLKTHDGYNLGTLCVIDREPRAVNEEQIADLRDLASVVMDQMELRLSALRAVGEARVLTREIHHRVGNSLQIVSSMLSMQSRRGVSGDVANELARAAERVWAIGRVHRHLQEDDFKDRVACLPFLRRLCAELADILHKQIEVEGIEIIVPCGQIQPIGLAVTELVTNAAKHGATRIRVGVTVPETEFYSLYVVDNGPGLDPDFSTSSASGLGLKLLSAFSMQIGGTLSAENIPGSEGACFKITFPAVNRSPQERT